MKAGKHRLGPAAALTGRGAQLENQFSGLQAENAHRTKSAYLSPFRKPKKEGDRNNNMSDGNCTV